MNYVAPWWLPGGQAQTIWPALYSRRVFGPKPHFRRERWITPDLDFIDIDFCDAAAMVPDPAASDTDRPLLVLFHGLEGSSGSHYSEAFADFARAHGMGFVVPHFRGCSGELNLAPRAYHSGDFEEVGWILKRLKSWHRGKVLAVGISLGGNALLRWAEEMGDQARQMVRAIAAVCAPTDLAAAGWAIGRGMNRQIYTRMFLRSMKPKALRKLEQHPGLFSREALLAARDLYEFDNVFTAPLHGFSSTEDYWARASAKPHLAQIRIPTLVVHARNDPFVPAWSLPRQDEVGSQVTLWQPAHGGHVGFPQGPLPGHVRSMPDAVGGWLLQSVK
ncbi:putative alpha/beta-fold hydrolase [Rhodoferax ferrireducens]|uniref:Alpha/beta-fold hydrolase n=1 Tax=Rhodoferax ferrireducens TaxID=192843 RepID=A0ABU2CEK9_9BURK|nr:alpha/beta fold hydrolase [Rhodoferax ferrireducens]MDR7379780.1 putative alpha/beta-fold hydrolase [Rhodoferax ferrireducens]